MRTIAFSNPAPLQPGPRIVLVDEIKGYAILLVLIYHVGGVFGWRNWLHGEVGVDIFLIVSGFMLTLTASTLPWQTFVTRRLLRIFPAYWLAYILFVLLELLFFKISPSGGSIVAHILGIHGYTHPSHFSQTNDSFWFISLILGLYGLFLHMRRRIRDISATIGLGALICALAIFGYRAFDHGGGVIHLAVRIPSFFLGVVAGQLLARGTITIQVSGLLVAGLAALLAVGWSFGIIPYYPFAAVVMLTTFLFTRQKFSHLPECRATCRVLALLGTYSYEIFLFHQPLIRDYNRIMMERWLGGATPSSGHLAIGLVIMLLLTLAISVAVHHTTAWLYRLARNRDTSHNPTRGTPTPLKLA